MTMTRMQGALAVSQYRKAFIADFSRGYATALNLQLTRNPMHERCIEADSSNACVVKDSLIKGRAQAAG